jgi:enoyl-CoA hydratase/carnithine racemase
MDYRDYQHLTFERRDRGVVLVTIHRPEMLNATNDRLLVVSYFSELNSV